MSALADVAVQPPATLTVVPWPDPVIDELGHDPRSIYVETFWLGVLGPSTTWLLRRLVAGLDVAPEGYELPLLETAKGLGIGHKGGVHSPFTRALGRCVQFQVARWQSPGELAVRRRVPPLSLRQVSRLSSRLQEEHHHWQEGLLHHRPGDRMRERCRRLALTLFELGEERETAERQLLHWHFHPALAYDSIAWAYDPARRRAAARDQVTGQTRHG